MLLDLESFNGFTTAELAARFTQLPTGLSGGTLVIAAGGPRSNTCLRSTSESQFHWKHARHVVPAADATFIQGYRLNFSTGALADLLVSTSVDDILGSTVLFRVGYLGGVQCWIRPNLDGTISAYRGTTLLGSSTRALSTGSWSFMEAQIVVHASTGSVLVKVDNVTYLNLTGQNTKNLATAAWNEYATPRLVLDENLHPDLVWDIADLYVCDGVTGDGCNALLGPVQVNPIYTVAEGGLAMSTPSSGSDREAMIDEGSVTGGTGPDSDTTYNTLAAVNDEDTFTHAAAPNPGATILGVGVKCFARKVSAGSALLKLGTRRGGTSYHGPDLGLASTYRYVSTMQGYDPVTAAAWVEANVNSAELSMKKSA